MLKLSYLIVNEGQGLGKPNNAARNLIMLNLVRPSAAATSKSLANHAPEERLTPNIMEICYLGNDAEKVCHLMTWSNFLCFPHCREKVVQ